MKITKTGGNGRRSLAADNGALVFTSGITSTNLEGDTAEQTRDVLMQLDNILRRHGTDKNNVLKAAIHLVSMKDYGAFNSVWDEWVTDGFEPAREVSEGGLAIEGYKVKISLIATK